MKKLIALFMAFVLLGSQVGYSIATHYCGGEVSDRAISLLGEELGCGMESMENSCASTNNGISEKSCCDDESSVYQLNEDFQQKQRSIESQTNFLAVFAINYFLLFDTEQVAENYQVPPQPPLIQQNTQVLFQSFLL